MHARARCRLRRASARNHTRGHRLLQGCEAAKPELLQPRSRAVCRGRQAGRTTAQTVQAVLRRYDPRTRRLEALRLGLRRQARRGRNDQLLLGLREVLLRRRQQRARASEFPLKFLHLAALCRRRLARTVGPRRRGTARLSLRRCRKNEAGWCKPRRQAPPHSPRGPAFPPNKGPTLRVPVACPSPGASKGGEREARSVLSGPTFAAILVRSALSSFSSRANLGLEPERIAATPVFPLTPSENVIVGSGRLARC